MLIFTINNYNYLCCIIKISYFKFFYQCYNIISEENFHLKISFIIFIIRNYIYSKYEKRIKSISGLTIPLNSCINLLLFIQLNQNSQVLAKDDDISDYFMYHKEKEYLLGKEEQHIEED